MKKIFLLTALAVSTLGLAQDISLGAKGGVNLATFSIFDTGAFEGDNKMVTAFHVGGMAEFRFTEVFSLQGEVVFSSQGNKTIVKEEFTGLEVTSVTKANYINVPMLFKSYIGSKLSVEGGPQVGFLMSVKNESETKRINSNSNQSNLPGPTTSTDKDRYKTTDIAFVTGLGYKLDNGLNFAARFNYGLTSVFKGETENKVYKNGVIQMSIGYFFN